MANAISHSVPVLKALWRLVQRGSALHVEAIARESQLTRARVRRDLRTLDAAHLIDSERLCLTLQGLALAVASSNPQSVRSSRRHSAYRRAAFPRVMLPVVSFRAPRPANVTGIADGGGV